MSLAFVNLLIKGKSMDDFLCSTCAAVHNYTNDDLVPIEDGLFVTCPDCLNFTQITLQSTWERELATNKYGMQHLAKRALKAIERAK